LYRHALKRFQHVTGDIALTEVTAEHFDRFKSRRLTAKTERKRNPKPRSVMAVNMELRTLKAAFSVAKRWRLIERHPFVECSLCPAPECPAAFFSPEDFERLIGTIPERWLREAVLFAVLTGIRRGELLSLTWPQVDFSRRVLCIQNSPTFRTKSGKRRIVPLSDTAVYLLKGRRGLSGSEFVFTKNDATINGDWLTHQFKEYVRDAGLDEGLHWHSLRHSFASWLVQRGATLYQVQALLGHSSASMTEVYSHLQPDQMHETVNRISVSMN
jgi:integrase